MQIETASIFFLAQAGLIETDGAKITLSRAGYAKLRDISERQPLLCYGANDIAECKHPVCDCDLRNIAEHYGLR